MSWSSTTFSTNSTIAKWEREINQLINTGTVSYLAEDVDLADATNPITDEVSSLYVGDGMGSLEIECVVTTTGIIADTKTLEIKMYGSTDDISFTEIYTGNILYSKTASDDFDLTEDDVLFRWVVPTGISDYIKPLINSDASNTGKISIYSVAKWQDKIDIAKLFMADDVEIRLLKDKTYTVDFSSGDDIKDLITNLTVFNRASDFKSLEFIYRDLAQNNEGGMYWKKAELYASRYEIEIEKAFSHVNIDIGLDGTADLYKQEITYSPTCTR